MVFYPPLKERVAVWTEFRLVYKKRRLVVFLCLLIHTNKIVTVRPPNIAKISPEQRP